MAQNFFILQNSTLPVLRMELINNGRYDFKSSRIINNALKNADVTFSMKDIENDRLVISKAPATVEFLTETSCEEKAILQYKWKKRDVKEKGTFIGFFEIKIEDEIKEEGCNYPVGKLIVPIHDDLIIIIK